MKKTKKGFTLTELIVAIAIMTLIVLIAVPAYKNIRRNVLEKQYENIIRLIETASSKYAAKYKTNMLVVQDLIDKGLIETDDGTNIYDPRNKKVLNCYLVEITYKKGNYIAKYLDKKSNNCKSDGSALIIVKKKGTNKVITPGNKWVNFDLTLGIKRSFSDATYRWVSSYGQMSKREEIDTNVKTILKATYSVDIISQGKSYWSKQGIKIDKENPIIKDVIIGGGNNWTTGREVTIKATDQSGSGIKGYYLDKADCNDSSVFQPSNKFNITSPELYDGENYYLCVKDKAGNITHHNELIYLELADKIAPTCKIIEENDEWTNKDVTVKLGCEDSISGCDLNYSTYERTITETTEKSLQTWQIKDKAGNVTNCEEEVNVYLDKTEPNINYSVMGNDAYAKSLQTKVEATDDHSGANDYIEYLWSTDANLEKSNITFDPTLKPNGNDFDNSQLTGIYYLYIKACDTVGNCKESRSDAFYADNTGPNINYSVNGNNAYAKRLQTKVEATDEHSGAKDYIEYLWSTDANLDQSNIPFHPTLKPNGNDFDNSQLTGIYYLYIKACDKLGNCSVARSDAFYADKTGPTISFGTNGSNTYAANASTTVTVTDNNSGVKSIDYDWSTISTSTSTTYTTSSGTRLTSSCGISGTEGNCYLYVKACDKLDNCNTARTNAFLVDRQAPTITKNNKNDSECISYHRCNSETTKACDSFKVTDRQWGSGTTSFTLYRSHCCADCRANDKNSCSYSMSGVTYNASNRLSYYLNNTPLADDEKTIDNGVRYRSGDFGMCTRMGNSLQYAFKVCDPVGNCTGINSFTS